jgi:hypothetical protein
VDVAAWPQLDGEGRAMLDTFHRWTQIVGKVRMAHATPLNHWWHVTLYVSPEGLRTSLVPHPGVGGFELTFDLLQHQLRIVRADGASRSVALEARSVADFHAEVLGRLAELDIDTPILGPPVELEDALPFAEDHEHASYDPEFADRLRLAFIHGHRVLSAFRSGFAGKASPVHFFWGAFDLAVTRFSGRPAPLHPGGAPNCADWVMHEAYSQEVSSAGFWPGGGAEGLFYAYAYPEPDGFRSAPLSPAGARYDDELREFVLPWEAARTADDPDAAVASFLESTYVAAADPGGWDRAALEMPADAAPPWSARS